MGSVTTYLDGSPSAGAPPGSAWPPAQRLVTKKMASGDQPSWLGGVRLFTRPGCPPTNPARACCPDNGPLLPRTWSSAGHWPSAGPPCARGVPLGGSPGLSFGEEGPWRLLSFLCPSTGCSRALLPFHGLRPTEMKVSPRNVGTRVGTPTIPALWGCRAEVVCDKQGTTRWRVRN